MFRQQNKLYKMNKGKQKPRTYYHEDAIRILHERHGYTKNYIRMSISGDRVGLMPDRIKKEYHQMVAASKKAVQEVANQQVNQG